MTPKRLKKHRGKALSSMRRREGKKGDTRKPFVRDSEQPDWVNDVYERWHNQTQELR